MAKDPAFLFYPSDFLTGTMFMSNEQVGIYIRLLCAQHQHGGIIDKASFNSMVGDNQLIRSKFIETEVGFFNERLVVEMEKRNTKSSNISEAVRKVWEKRKKSDGIPLQSQRNRKRIAMGTENENENENENINRDENGIEKGKKVRKKTTFGIPTLSEVQDYFFQNGYTRESGAKAWEYYNSGNWHDSKGNPVKNWKQKMQGVWFKDENLIVKPVEIPKQERVPDLTKFYPKS